MQLQRHAAPADGAPLLHVITNTHTHTHTHTHDAGAHTHTTILEMIHDTMLGVER